MWTFITYEAGWWEALYNPEGEKVLEGHSLQVRDVLKLVGTDCTFATASPEVDDESGWVPDRLSEYPPGGYS